MFHRRLLESFVTLRVSESGSGRVTQDECWDESIKLVRDIHECPPLSLRVPRRTKVLGEYLTGSQVPGGI